MKKYILCAALASVTISSWASGGDRAGVVTPQSLPSDEVVLGVLPTSTTGDAVTCTDQSGKKLVPALWTYQSLIASPNTISTIVASTALVGAVTLNCVASNGNLQVSVAAEGLPTDYVQAIIYQGNTPVLSQQLDPSKAYTIEYDYLNSAHTALQPYTMKPGDTLVYTYKSMDDTHYTWSASIGINYYTN